MALVREGGMMATNLGLVTPHQLQLSFDVLGELILKTDSLTGEDYRVLRNARRILGEMIAALGNSVREEV